MVLKYSDETGFSLSLPLCYGWSPRGKPLRVPKHRGSAERINLMGSLSRSPRQLEYRLLEERCKAPQVLAYLEALAQEAAASRRLTVAVPDNAGPHHAKLIQARRPEWEGRDFYLRFLPPYSPPYPPHLNPIEAVWRRLKAFLLPRRYYPSEDPLKAAVLSTLPPLSASAIGQTHCGDTYLLAVGVCDNGDILLEGTPRDLFKLPARVAGEAAGAVPHMVETLTQARREAVQTDINQRNADFFEREANRLDSWADDMKVGLERETKELDRQISEARRAASLANSLQEKLEGQKQIKTLEATRSAKSRSLFEAQDEIDQMRGNLIEDLEAQLQQKQSLEEIFTIRWRVI